jgi:hypothetical protein
MKTFEKHIIWKFAAGDRFLRDEAIAIHRKYLNDMTSIEQKFMSEIDNPVPDFLLRAFYRKELLKQYEEWD